MARTMARLENFTMYAKDRESAGAVLSMKVEGNAGPEIDKAVRKDLINLRTFHMEYDVCSRKGRLPACFARGFGLQVGPFVMLRDPNQNEIEVGVEKKNGKVYFADGWTTLKSFYGIFGGAWVTVVYANRHLFLIEVRNLHGEEVLYPPFNPPRRMFLQNKVANEYRNSLARYGSNGLFLPTVFYHSVVKELNADDVSSGMLKLNWLGFCQAAFPPEVTHLTVIDYLGYTWKLVMDFCKDELKCVFSGDWQAMCNARKLVEGTKIKLGVTEAINNTVVYLCPPPMLVLKTTVPSSEAAGENGPTYCLEQYLWNN